MWRRVVTVAAGVVLIALGLVDWHVQTGAVVAGLVLVGAVSGDELARIIRTARQRQNGNGNGERR